MSWILHFLVIHGPIQLWRSQEDRLAWSAIALRAFGRKYRSEISRPLATRQLPSDAISFACIRYELNRPQRMLAEESYSGWHQGRLVLIAIVWLQRNPRLGVPTLAKTLTDDTSSNPMLDSFTVAWTRKWSSMFWVRSLSNPLAARGRQGCSVTNVVLIAKSRL